MAGKMAPEKLQRLQQAMTACQVEHCTTYAAARRFGVVQSTLWKWLRDPPAYALGLTERPQSKAIADVDRAFPWEVRHEVEESIHRAWQNLAGALILEAVRDTRCPFGTRRKEAKRFLGSRWCEFLRRGAGISDTAWHRILSALADPKFELANVHIARTERRRRGEDHERNTA